MNPPTDRLSFPASFSWGTASSATQSQGATPADNWWTWERAGRVPSSGDGNAFGTRYAGDFALLSEWGFSDYRMSLDWARLEPEPGRHDPHAVELYRAMLTAGRDAGLTMWVCLLHTALPQWFADQGGFLSPQADETWARHVAFVAETFADLADGWMPINNPTAFAQKAYLTGTFPPGHTSQEEFLTALQAIHRADFEAALILRQTGKPTSTNEALLTLHPTDDSSETAGIAALIDSVVWDSWLNLVRNPRYENAFDLYGFSYYFSPAINAAGDLLPHPAHTPVGPQGYVAWAPGLGEVLARLHQELPGKRFLVAEIGYGGDDDGARSAYLRDAITQVHDAIGNGIDVRGIHLWTAIDNYEWLDGHNVAFGLFDAHRAPRTSARMIRELMRP
ncbi:family 1 glycosylhydrolase [Streptomyces sp. NPDC002564]|uniref:family 1 glycosylhydrolase n=1 Tax=Streptomyces sp. NPDC002564 TaxID=3364649 RepID=UPI0036B139E2